MLLPITDNIVTARVCIYQLTTRGETPGIFYRDQGDEA